MRSRGCLNTPGFVLTGKTGIGEVDRLQNVVTGPDLTDIGQHGAKTTARTNDSMAGDAARPVSEEIYASLPHITLNMADLDLLQTLPPRLVPLAQQPDQPTCRHLHRLRILRKQGLQLG